MAVLSSTRLREHGFHFRHGTAGCGRQIVPAPGCDHSSPEHEPLDLVGIEGERWQLEAALQVITDAGLTANRNSRILEIANVAVHRSLRNAEFAGQLGTRRAAPVCPQLAS